MSATKMRTLMERLDRINSGQLNESQAEMAIRKVFSSKGKAQLQALEDMLDLAEKYYAEIYQAGDEALDALSNPSNRAYAYLGPKWNYDMEMMFKKATFQYKMELLKELERVAENFGENEPGRWL